MRLISPKCYACGVVCDNSAMACFLAETRTERVGARCAVWSGMNNKENTMNAMTAACTACTTIATCDAPVEWDAHDFGACAEQTPLSVLARRAADGDVSAARELGRRVRWTYVDPRCSDPAAAAARGSYQRGILAGYESSSGSTIRGRAKKYSCRYAASRGNLYARLEALGLEVVRVPGPRGRLVLVIVP